jgi:predicted house-cleaning noncanonical NTP pyrophosphatase (MazG superfamily)
MGPERNGEKLVRHLTPAFIEKRDGRRMTTRVVEGEEHVRFLGWKVLEEAEEVAAADAKTFSEELGDLRQALADFCAVAGIKVGGIALPEAGDVPTDRDARIAYFRAQIVRLVEMAGAIPPDEREAAEHIGRMLGVINAVTDIAGIRDDVRAKMAAKVRERGGFIPGIAWKVVEKSRE